MKYWKNQILVLLVPLLIVLAAPTCAAATGSWVVKGADGTKIGKAVRVSSGKALVRTTSGEDAGAINKSSELRNWWTAYGYLLGPLDAMHIRYAKGKSPVWQLRGFAELGPLPLMGRVAKRGGRWLVQSGNRRRGWTTQGSLPGSCPAWVAGGAVFLVQPDSF